MNIKIEKVFERDIDLLVINKLINEKNVLDFFEKKIGLEGYELINIEHSHSDIELGETDIMAIIQNGRSRIGLLIENKIDAPAMDLQPERYIQRGNKGIENGLYDEYRVFIIAPEQYLKTNSKAEKYPNRISYEELKELMCDDEYAVALFNKAIEEKESGYIVIEDKMVTEFWHNYYEFIRNNYPQIKIHEIDGPRGANANWPELITEYPQIKIIHKSDRGYMDLTFGQMASHVEVFDKYVNSVLTEYYKPIKTGKSVSIRIKVPCIDFKNEFENYIKEMHICMKSALELYGLLSKINVLMMYDEIK